MKRADFRIEPLVAISIAIAVFAIAGFGGYLILNDKISFFDFLPNFNVTKDPQKDIEIVRYEILNGKIEYYDGINWFEFNEDERILGSKILNIIELEKNLNSYWLGWEGSYESTGIPYSEIFSERGLRERSIKTKSGVYNLGIKGFVYNGDFYSGKGEQFVRFSVEGRPTVYRLSLRNELYSEKENYNPNVKNVDRQLYRLFVDDELEGSLTPQKDKDLYEQFGMPIIEWRDEIIKVPISINYKDEKSGSEQRGYYCVKKIMDYIVVDLSKSVGRNEVC